MRMSKCVVLPFRPDVGMNLGFRAEEYITFRIEELTYDFDGQEWDAEMNYDFREEEEECNLLHTWKEHFGSAGWKVIKEGN